MTNQEALFVYLPIWVPSLNNPNFLLEEPWGKLLNLVEVEILVGIQISNQRVMIKPMPNFQKRLKIQFLIDSELSKKWKNILIRELLKLLTKTNQMLLLNKRLKRRTTNQKKKLKKKNKSNQRKSKKQKRKSKNHQRKKRLRKK